MQKNTIRIVLLLISTLSISACDKDQQEFTKKLEKQIKSAINDISKNPSQPIEEIKKLHQVEYKTVVFALETDVKLIDTQLNELGQDRWQCFSSFARPRSKPADPEIIILCKRTPETVLRYVPSSILGR